MGIPSMKKVKVELVFEYKEGSAGEEVADEDTWKNNFSMADDEEGKLVSVKITDVTIPTANEVRDMLPKMRKVPRD